MGEVSFEWSNPKPEYFDQLFQWKSDQFRNARRTAVDPAVMPVLRELAFMDNDDCRGLIGVLSAGEQDRSEGALDLPDGEVSRLA
jgi:CelD/BcsL family acetyltransferase involved in cellulose biosynthesis